MLSQDTTYIEEERNRSLPEFSEPEQKQPQQQQQPQPQQQPQHPESEQKGSPASYITRVRLMDQGTFGCIYRPEIECETGNAGEYAYVSKVQKMTRTIQNEVEIGNAIKEIPHYMFWYSPILKTCPIYFSTLKKYEEQGEACKAVQDSLKDSLTTKKETAKNVQFISSKIRYAGKYIIDYLLELPRDVCEKKIISTYAYLDAAITRLNKHGIIHNDIKENNVLYDAYNQSPNIIDFGISYKVSDLGDETKEKMIFYTTKFYPYWCIHVYLLCVGVFSEQSVQSPININAAITEETMAGVYESYMTEFNKFAEETEITRILDIADMEKHKEQYWAFVKPYIGKSWANDLRPALLKTHLHWDKYSLAIMYMVMICKIEQVEVPKTFIEKLRMQFAGPYET